MVFLVAVFATTRLGALLVPLNTRLAAPEVEAEMELTAASDQYALAGILVELIAGRAYSRLDDHLPSEVPERWVPVLRRALDADPGARWGSVRALAATVIPSSITAAASRTLAMSTSSPPTRRSVPTTGVIPVAVTLSW